MAPAFWSSATICRRSVLLAGRLPVGRVMAGRGRRCESGNLRDAPRLRNVLPRPVPSEAVVGETAIRPAAGIVGIVASALDRLSHNQENRFGGRAGPGAAAVEL